MEQFEDGQEDHNVLASLPGATVEISSLESKQLIDFVLGVFEHIKGKRIALGRFLGPEEAGSYVRSPLDADG